MNTAVLDTNVLASGFVRPEPAPGRLLQAWRSQLFTLLVSEPILGELARTFEEPYFRRHLTPAERAQNLALLRGEAVITPLTVEVHGVATHPEDDLILATAASARADYLVTGDAKLQGLGSFQGVTIVGFRAFLDLMMPGRPDRPGY